MAQNRMQKKRIVIRIGGKSLSSGGLIRSAAKLMAIGRKEKEIAVAASTPVNSAGFIVWIR